MRAAPESSALGTNPRTAASVTSGPYSAELRLEVRITAEGSPRRGQPGGDLEAVEIWQLHVEQHEVGLELLRRRDGRLTVAGLADHVEALGFEQSPRAGPERRMVVDDQDAHHGTHSQRASGSGTYG